MLGHLRRDTAAEPEPVGIAAAPDGIPIQMRARLTRVTIQPRRGWMLLTLSDGSGEARVAFRREDAPDLPTGALVVAEGIFAAGSTSPRAFDAVAVSLADDRGSATS
jgi:hypothetical protein